jgi:hypothetical protein
MAIKKSCLESFAIAFNNKDGVYFAGQEVSGTVKFKINFCFQNHKLF